MGHKEVLEKAARHACAFLDGLEKRSVAPTEDPFALRERMSKPLADDGVAAEQVIDELVRDVDAGLIGSAGGRFFAWVIGGGVPSAVEADWLAATWDQNSGLV